MGEGSPENTSGPLDPVDADPSEAGPEDDQLEALPEELEEPSENPLARRFAFTLAIPPITVRMVDASALADYEIWLFASSLTSSAGVGFGVAFFQSLSGPNTDWTSGAVAVVFLFLFVVFFLRALALRRLIGRRAREYRMSAADLDESSD